MHEFEIAENACLEALAPLKSLGLKDLAAYSGQLDVENIEEVRALFPCIFVAAGPIETVPELRRDLLKITLIIGDQNRRNHQAAARGDSQSPGVYALMEYARAHLHGKQLVPGWRSFRRQGEACLAYAPKKRICLYEAVYQTDI